MSSGKVRRNSLRSRTDDDKSLAQNSPLASSGTVDFAGMRVAFPPQP
ncbi:hypothetical protein [Bradyrhizobium sp. 2S1]|nr:hypothetical protein [Bradyrhizobium sp. 2S1]MCK7667824.1 hypothetical protein [Bradyrhizobium sp. 2S1]